MNKCKIIVRNKKVNDLNDRTKTMFVTVGYFNNELWF
jgi:hypothetical protein